MKKGRKVSNIVSFLLGNASFFLLSRFIYSNRSIDEKDKKYCQLFDNWLILNERGSRIEEYFHARGIKEVAVYGYSNIGRHLVTQLIRTDIKIKYIIDKRNVIIEYGIDRYCLRDKLPEVEAVIVTPICEFQTIKKEVSDKVSCEVISIEDIIYELL